MNVFIRTDASILIGTGHVMRCIALAEQLKKLNNTDVVFICKVDDGNLIEWIRMSGFEVHSISTQEWSFDKDAVETIDIIKMRGYKADWIIVDHYQLDFRWEAAVKNYTHKIMVIDDLANRQHICDLLVDHDLYFEMDKRYLGKVPENCTLLLGPKYTFLRPEFYKARTDLPIRDGLVQRILVFLGGSDPFNTTMKVLRALSKMSLGNMNIDVVVGALNPNIEQIKLFCKQNESNFIYHFQIENMAELIAAADLAIGAGGVTLWERCFLGLPTLTIIQAENQRLSTETVSAYAAAWNLGWDEQLTENDLLFQIQEVLESPKKLKEVGLMGIQLMGDPEKHGISLILENML